MHNMSSLARGERIRNRSPEPPWVAGPLMVWKLRGKNKEVIHVSVGTDRCECDDSSHNQSSRYNL